MQHAKSRGKKSAPGRKTERKPAATRPIDDEERAQLDNTAANCASLPSTPRIGSVDEGEAHNHHMPPSSVPSLEQHTDSERHPAPDAMQTLPPARPLPVHLRQVAQALRPFVQQQTPTPREAPAQDETTLEA